MRAAGRFCTEAATELSARMTLDAYEHAVRSNPQRTAERRHRIQHFAAVADDDLPRLARLEVLPSLRPLGAPSVAEGPASRSVAALVRRVGVSSGRLSFGSGWPSGSLNPLESLGAVAGAATGSADDDVAPLSLKTAIDAYTSGAAWASFDDQRKGTIAPGMLADIVVLSDDIFKCASATLPAMRASKSRSSTARWSIGAPSTPPTSRLL